MAGAQVAWGIDVGVSSLKAIKLRRDGDRVLIEAFDVIEHDKFLSEEGADRDALIRSTLQRFMAKYGLRNDVVFIGVPGSTTFARFVKLPPVETRKIPEIVRFEAIQQIPFPLEQVNWDYHTFQHPESPDVEVGIFAMKKELVAQIMSNFRAVNMNVQGVQMTPLAVYNAAAYDGMTEDKGTVIIDMGAEHTDIVIMDQGRVWLRSIGIGGNHFTDALAKSFKQQFGKAEKLKKEAATSKYQKQIYQAMRPIFADLVAEIQRSLGAYNSSHRDSRLERIVGMGNPFKLPNLQKYLQQELKMDVVRLETFKQANIEKAAAFSENILSMTAAYGLAIQALGLATIDTNLLPTEIARAMMWKKKQPWFIGAAALLMLGGSFSILQHFSASHAFAASQESDEATRHDSEQVANDTLVQEWNKIDNSFDNAKKQVDEQIALVSTRTVWPMIVSDVFSSLPQPGNTGPVIVITSMTSDYSAALSTVPLATQGQPGTPQPATPAPGTPATPSGQVFGPSDRGFRLTISGYTRDGSFGTMEKFQDAIVNKARIRTPAASADGTPPATRLYAPEGKSYYYQGLPADGYPIKVANANPGGGVFGGGGAFGGGPPVGATGAEKPGDRPWGKVKGPFWDNFYTDLTGYHPPLAPAVQGQQPTEQLTNLDAGFPLDMVGTRVLTPLQPRSMNGMYSFTIKINVHLTNE